MFYTILFLLLIKHGVCDYIIQGRLSIKYETPKTSFSSKRLWMHARDHGLGTALIFLLTSLYCITFGYTQLIVLLSISLGLIDWAIHGLIDYTKNRIIKDTKLKSDETLFWYVTGVDQMLHYSTYMVFVLVFDIYFF